MYHFSSLSLPFFFAPRLWIGRFSLIDTSKPLSVAIVGVFWGYRWYSCELAAELLKSLGRGDHLVLYGNAKSSVKCSETLIPRAVWTPRLYPFQIIRHCINDHVSIVHIQFEFVTFGIPNSILTCVLLALCKIARIKSVVTLHGPIFPRNVPKEVIAGLLPSRSRIPVVLAKIYVSSLYIVFSKLASKLVVHSKVFGRWLGQVGINNWQVIPHGVPETPTQSSVGNTGFPPRNTVLFFGNVSPRKGIENLIRAFKPLAREDPNVTLIIAGSAPPHYQEYLASLKKLVEEEGIAERVIFTGHVDGETTDHLYREARVVVVPYLFSISASGPLALALSYSKPIVASTTEYFMEQLSDGSGALLVAPDDIGALSEAIERVLKSESLRDELAHNISMVRAQKSWKSVAMATLDLYRRILQ
jgi:glycosyltransferase involved in cell wall biosynthesis